MLRLHVTLRNWNAHLQNLPAARLRHCAMRRRVFVQLLRPRGQVQRRHGLVRSRLVGLPRLHVVQLRRLVGWRRLSVKKLRPRGLMLKSLGLMRRRHVALLSRGAVTRKLRVTLLSNLVHDHKPVWLLRK